MTHRIFGPLEASPSERAERGNPSVKPLLTPSMLQALERFAKSKGLTQRETQVLLMVCQGNKDLMIANRLKISRATVRFHIKNIHRKSETSDKLEIVLTAWRDCAERCKCC